MIKWTLTLICILALVGCSTVRKPASNRCSDAYETLDLDAFPEAGNLAGTTFLRCDENEKMRAGLNSYLIKVFQKINSNFDAPDAPAEKGRITFCFGPNGEITSPVLFSSDNELLDKAWMDALLSTSPTPLPSNECVARNIQVIPYRLVF